MKSGLSVRTLYRVLLLASLPAAVIQAAVQQDGALAIQVVDQRSGKALDGVAVCLGTAADISQFGAQATDDRGRVRFASVPHSLLQVTASKSGYQAEQVGLDPVTSSRSLVLKLASGWRNGPRCKVTTTGQENTSTLSIASVNVSPLTGRAGVVRVRTNVRGEAGQIRVSESADFVRAKWRPYQPVVDFQLSPGNGGKQLYVQVRRVAKMNGATLQSLSPVVSARLGRR